MSDDELRHLRSDEVVRLVRGLEARIAELEAELARRSGPPKTPTNSSTPPAKGFKRAKAPGGDAPGVPRGARAGHLGTSRRRGRPDRVVLCQPVHCGHCGRDLTAAPQQRIGVSQVVELPPVQPVVVEAWRYEATCPGCGRHTAAGYPAGLEAARVVGPHLEATLVYLHEQHHVGYERLVTVCQELFGLTISEGLVANVLRRAAARLAPQAAAIQQQVRASPVVGSDETSARVQGRTWWQWVFQTPEASYHVIGPRRNTAVVEAFQADTSAEVWGSDLYAPQLKARAARHQICLSHEIRALQYAIDAEQSLWATQVQALLQVAIHLAHERDAGHCRGERYAEAVAMIAAWTNTLLASPVPGAEASRLWVRYRTHRQKLFVFLDDPRVPPTNNASEQALRNSVVHRKVTGGFRSDWGAEAHATVTTVLQTARKQGQAVLRALHDVLGAPITHLPYASPSPGR